jgi:hypothetical protein
LALVNLSHVAHGFREKDCRAKGRMPLLSANQASTARRHRYDPEDGAAQSIQRQQCVLDLRTLRAHAKCSSSGLASLDNDPSVRIIHANLVPMWRA